MLGKVRVELAKGRVRKLQRLQIREKLVDRGFLAAPSLDLLDM